MAGSLVAILDDIATVLDDVAAGEGSDDALAMERKRISAAIRTDFILSAKIIVITLGVVAGKPLVTQLGVMVAVSSAMTIGVYGLVAAIMKIVDVGALLAARTNRLARVGDSPDEMPLHRSGELDRDEEASGHRSTTRWNATRSRARFRNAGRVPDSR